MKISVALCTYNGEKFIERQLESIFNQSLAVSEIIICDDNSTDKTDEVISKFINSYPNIIHFYKNEINVNCVSKRQCYLSKKYLDWQKTQHH